MKHSTGKYLNDVLISIDRIKGYIADIEFEQYKKDDGLKDAVERRLSIIGEALFQIYRTGEIKSILQPEYYCTKTHIGSRL